MAAPCRPPDRRHHTPLRGGFGWRHRVARRLAGTRRSPFSARRSPSPSAAHRRDVAASDRFRGMSLFRGMKRDGEMPLVGGGARGLDIRRGCDIAALNDDDLVGPGLGGLSTAPDEPRLLQRHRRPESLGGTGRDPVWSIQREHLSPHGLASRRDSPQHELVEAAEEVELRDLIKRIHGTAANWSLEYE